MEVIKDERYTGGTPFIDLIEVSGLKGALHGMRNPLNSWRLADSIFFDDGSALIKENDMKLAKRLIKGGSEHRKFLRMIHVQFDLNMPRYIWSEFDTYHYNTKNSTSTMHKLFNKDDEKGIETELDKILATQGKLNRKNFWYYKDDDIYIFEIIERLNLLREMYLQQSTTPKEKIELKRRAKQLLPESYLQMRTVDTNYEELMNIYKQRRHHQMNIEWGLICDFIKDLPYMKEFLGLEED